MKTRLAPRQPRRGSRTRAGAPGFTLAEMLVSSGVFSMAMLALIYAQLAGLRYDQLVASKAGASETSRRGFDLLTAEIRSAKLWSVGNGSQSAYVACGNGTNQQGNAIQLHSTTATNTYVRYFFDQAKGRLCRAISSKTGYSVIAENLTNTMSFRAESYDGNVVQDLQYKYVIATTLEFAQFQYPLTRVGPKYYYNYYRLQLKAASHCPN